MFKNNGKLKLLIIVGTRPEIIRLAAVINKCRKYFDVVLAHMLPGYTHNIINLSDTEDLVTVMWANESFDPNRPDTYFDPVK